MMKKSKNKKTSKLKTAKNKKKASLKGNSKSTKSVEEFFESLKVFRLNEPSEGTIKVAATIIPDATDNTGDGYDGSDNTGDWFSDVELKTNIECLFGSLSKILQLQGVQFNWKADQRLDVGLIAQDVEKIYPMLVSEGKDGFKKINYAALVAPLIESSKELLVIIKKLELRIEKLESKKNVSITY